MQHAEPRQITDVIRKERQRAPPQQPGQHGSDPHVAKAHLGVRNEVEHQTDNEDEENCGCPAYGDALQHDQARVAGDDAGEPARLGDIHGADREQSDQEQQTCDDEHHERDELVLKVARLFLNAPRVVDGGRHGAEDAHRGPHHQHTASDAQLYVRALQRGELHFDEIELPWKVAKDEPEQRVAIRLAVGHERDEGQREEKKGKERQEGVVGDRGGEGQVVAVVDARQPAPDRLRRQADFDAHARQRPPRSRGASRGLRNHAAITSRVAGSEPRRAALPESTTPGARPSAP